MNCLLPYLHALDSATIAGEGGDVGSFAGDGEGGGGLEAGEWGHHAGLSRGGAVSGHGGG